MYMTSLIYHSNLLSFHLALILFYLSAYNITFSNSENTVVKKLKYFPKFTLAGLRPKLIYMAFNRFFMVLACSLVSLLG